jgi:hypothetical protein
MRSWQAVTGDEICMVLGLIMLMDIVQKPTLNSYFSRDIFSIKTSELWESSTRYLWNPIVFYTGVGSDITVKSPISGIGLSRDLY